MSLQALLDYGCIPYIATSEHLINCFELNPFGIKLQPFFDGPEETNFHLAYIRSNTIAFEADLSMPNWVYIDHVLLQTAAIGFMLPKTKLPRDILAQFDSDPLLEMDKVKCVPISGQTAGLAADGKTWTGVSLFSLSKYLPDLRSLGIATFTRAMALKAYRAKKYVGITQYDNPAVAIHGKTTKAIYIKQPAVWIHPRTHMTFIYEQEIDFELEDLKEREPEKYSYLLSAYDLEKKLEIAEGLKAGKRYKIVPPYRILEGDNVFLPILELPS